MNFGSYDATAFDYLLGLLFFGFIILMGGYGGKKILTKRNK